MRTDERPQLWPQAAAARQRISVEIGHVWVHPDTRRLGLARRLLGAVEREATARGLTVVRLDTHAALTEAQAMYRACGYTDIPAYDDNVYASHWFEKRLPGPTAADAGADCTS